MTRLNAFIAGLLAFGLVVSGQDADSSNDTATYTNPILNQVGADPWVIQDGDYYYMTYTTVSLPNIVLREHD